jgi:LacI family transcriptional regulator
MVEKSRVTLHDVADLAGVSHQTVSRVINNSTRVRPETKERVEAAILELDYRPNVIARSMAKGKTRTLGCIAPNLTDPVFAKIIEGAQTEARRQGYFILIGSASNETHVRPLLDELLNRRVDGMIILNARDDDRYKMLLPLISNGSPVVYIKNSPDKEAVSSVRCDDVLGGYLATKHLLDLGHEQIAVILGPTNEQCTPERLEGYQKALTEAGIEYQEKLITQGDWSALSGSNAVKELISSSAHFSAIFSMNDRMAAGAIRTLREAGNLIPQDYSVIGYDNVPLAELIDPPLTTIHQPLDQYGEQAVKILIQTIRDPYSERIDLCISPELIQRKSSAPKRK